MWSKMWNKFKYNLKLQAVNNNCYTSTLEHCIEQGCGIEHD